MKLKTQSTAPASISTKGRKAARKTQWKKIPGVRERALAVGRQLRSFRESSKRTLEKLSELTGKKNPSGRRITAAQISRIENGLVAAALPELELLCLALERDFQELFQPASIPWFVIRKNRSEEWLQEILSEPPKRIIKRQTERHSELIKSGVYRYIPLEDDSGTDEAPGLVLQNERSGTMRPLMRKNLLIVGKIDETEIRNIVVDSLDSHPGEEIIYVLEGELEFWYAETRGDPPQRLELPLGPGDCLHFSSNLLHAFRAPGRTAVRAFQVFCESGETRRDFYEEPQSRSRVF
jgi:transcriptional regulator with XRE-family HTH domain